MRCAAVGRETLPEKSSSKGEEMKVTETISTTPVVAEKSLRGEEVRVLTTCRAGKIVPVTYIPMLREDRVSRGSIRLRFEMAETLYPLMNAVNVTAFAHFVPFTALRDDAGNYVFDGMDDFNRSYQGVADPATGQVKSFFSPVTIGAAEINSEVFKKMGMHFVEGEILNARRVLEAYRTVVNFRREARSSKLPLHAGTFLASAFWKQPTLAHIVPDFDAAMLDGAVNLSWTNATLSPAGTTGTVPVKNLWRMPANASFQDSGASGFQGKTLTSTSGASPLAAKSAYALGTSSGGVPLVDRAAIFESVRWELGNSGVMLSLANIELAKKTAAFAKLREQYHGVSDDHLIDLLMEGIRVPDEQLRQPILLDRKSTIFGYTERHATDGDNLDKSVTTGLTELTLNFRTPPMNTGGIIMITVEIVPEQLWERMDDVFLRTVDPAKLPNFMRDYLDPEKVEVVQNRYVDVRHSAPDGVFGYAPLNHAWKRSITRIGGKYFRPDTQGFVEDRQRFWSVEKTDPKLTEDFYLVGDLPHTVFADTTADPFEILALGSVQIVGNTVFGKALEEDNGDFDAVMEQVDTQRIVQE